MTPDSKNESVVAGRPMTWVLPLVLLFGITVPFLGTSLLGNLFPGWKGLSMTFHSTLENGN